MDTGYLPFYFQGYRILSILLPGIWDTLFILVSFRDIEYLGKLMIMGIFIRDRPTCLLTSWDMGYLLPPIQASFINVSTCMTTPYQ